MSSIYVINYPLFASLIDKDKGKEELYAASRNFFLEGSVILEIIIIAFIHQITFYQPGAASQDPLAIVGIRIIMAAIPMGLYLIAIILMVKVFRYE